MLRPHSFAFVFLYLLFERNSRRYYSSNG